MDAHQNKNLCKSTTTAHLRALNRKIGRKIGTIMSSQDMIVYIIIYPSLSMATIIVNLTIARVFDNCKGVWQLQGCLTIARVFDNCTRVWQLHACLTIARVFDNCTRVWQLHACLTIARVFDNCTSVWQLHECFTIARVFDNRTWVWQLIARVFICSCLVSIVVMDSYWFPVSINVAHVDWL